MAYQPFSWVKFLYANDKCTAWKSRNYSNNGKNWSTGFLEDKDPTDLERGSDLTFYARDSGVDFDPLPGQFVALLDRRLYPHSVSLHQWIQRRVIETRHFVQGLSTRDHHVSIYYYERAKLSGLLVRAQLSTFFNTKISLHTDVCL